MDLCEEGGRYLQVVDAALVGRCAESCDVAHYPPAKSDEDRPAVGPGAQQLAVKRVQALPGLVRLAVAKHDAQAAGTGRRKGGFEARGIEWRDRFVGDDRRQAPRDVRHEGPGVVEEAGADVDWIGAAAELDAQRARLAHRAPPAAVSCSRIAASTRLTNVEVLWDPVSTIACAQSR